MFAKRAFGRLIITLRLKSAHVTKNKGAQQYLYGWPMAAILPPRPPGLAKMHSCG
jgi:hypothetical protein